jgi:hypothetical protein
MTILLGSLFYGERSLTSALAGYGGVGVGGRRRSAIFLLLLSHSTAGDGGVGGRRRSAILLL